MATDCFRIWYVKNINFFGKTGSETDNGQPKAQATVLIKINKKKKEELRRTLKELFVNWIRTEKGTTMHL